VEAELAFGPENLGTERSEIRRRIGDVADRAGIRPLLGRETSALSGGERQLLAMGGILMLEPRLYVVDEPLANLDPASAARLLAILRTLADEGHAIVIVEHRVEEALDLRPDRVLYLDEGVTRYPARPGFLGSPTRAVRLPFDAFSTGSEEPASALQVRRRPARPRAPSRWLRASVPPSGRLRITSPPRIDARSARGRRGARPERVGEDHALRFGDAPPARPPAPWSAPRSWPNGRPARIHFGAASRARQMLLPGRSASLPGPATCTTTRSHCRSSRTSRIAFRGHPRRPLLTLSFGQQ
jgi:energy-coupling factor transporter ATP-binding protein EcfA2